MHFNLDELELEQIKFIRNYSGLLFIYNGKKYYYKRTKNITDFYNEMIAEKIANRLGISCCHYFLGTCLDEEGTISECFENPNYISMNDYLKEKYPESDPDERNNLEDIWNAFYHDFSEKTVNKLMTELVNIFMFDILIGNYDRHNENYGLVIDGDNTHFAPLFDNEKMLSERSIEDGGYALGVEREDSKKMKEYSTEYQVASCQEEDNLLYKFLNLSDFCYQEQLKEYLKIINEESINEIFTELENEGIDIERPIRKLILKRFADNRNMITNYFSSKKIK